MNWRASLEPPRGKLLFDEPLAPFSWFRVGGAAQALFLPADEDDLSAFLERLPIGIEVTVLGVGSNVIIRDGGIEGVVVRLAGKSFAAMGCDRAQGAVTAGAGSLDSAIARGATAAGIGGLEFLAGIPGTVGGALTMNAGCYGSETKDVLVSARAFDRHGLRRDFEVADLRYGYRCSEAPAGLIWTAAVFRGAADGHAAIGERMAAVTARRESTQPIREKTGGSTFRNPPGDSAWRLIDAAGWRGKPFGGAMFSPLHANFMINTGSATAADLEGLGEAVRTDVEAKFGVVLEWEIKRLGKFAP